MKLIIIIFLLLSNYLLPQKINDCGTTIPRGIRPEEVNSNDLHLYKDNTTYNLRLALMINCLFGLVTHGMLKINTIINWEWEISLLHHLHHLTIQQENITNPLVAFS